MITSLSYRIAEVTRILTEWPEADRLAGVLRVVRAMQSEIDCPQYQGPIGPPHPSEGAPDYTVESNGMMEWSCAKDNTLKQAAEVLRSAAMIFEASDNHGLLGHECAEMAARLGEAAR